MGAQESLDLICWLQQFTLVIQSSVKVSHAQFQTIKIIKQLLSQPTADDGGDYNKTQFEWWEKGNNKQ